MKKRCFTIMIIPHTEETTISLRLPFYAVQFIVILAALLVTGLGLLGFSYLKVAAEAEQVEELRQINQAQQEEIDALALETEQAMNKVVELDELIEKITEKVSDVELIDDVESLRKQAEESRKKLSPSASQSPYHNTAIIRYPSAPTLHSLNGILFESNATSNNFNSHYQTSSSSNLLLSRAAENIETLQDVIPEQRDTLDEVEVYVEKIEDEIRAIEAKPTLWPARGRITSGFGTRSKPYSEGYQFHSGVDIAGSHGSTIRATATGKITFSGYRGSMGNLLIIDHGDGYETYYAHLSDFAVSKGAEVEKGQTIGYMGASGRTTGTHLHYEVHYNGSPINPVHYMKEH
ncbi:MAG: peptidoglycan DD-metalloendopeptidase family protein [Bacillota bacterium]